MPSPGQSSRSGKYTSNLSQSTISSPSPQCPPSTFGDSAFSGGSNDGSRLYANQQHSYLESMLTKHNVRNVRNAPQPESMALFNDAFLNHLSLKDSYPKRPNPTEYAFHSAAPQVPSFSSVPAAYDYINPMIRSVNGAGSGAPEAASSTASASTKSRETPPPLLASSRMSAFTDQENVAPAAPAAPMADLSQYINPEIHSAHPAFRNPNGLGKNGRKEPRPDTFKTVMCQAWLESTYCAFGAECKFAHGEGELRPAVLPIRNSQKYKTKLCDKYTTTGICPYGRRCLFIHPDPASSEAYRRHVVAQTLVQNTIGLPLKSSAPAPPETPVAAAPASPDPTESDSSLMTPFSSRPHPSWPLESPNFFNRYPSRPMGAWRAAMKTSLESESVKETIREQNASMQPTQENHQREAIRMAARAAAAAAHQTGAPLGMTEEDLAEHLALQLIELQRTQSSSSAFGHLVDEQTSRLHQTHSLPNSRHSSISPFSNASTGSTSGIWSNTQSPEDVFTDNVFYHEDNDHQTPKFSAPSVIRRPKKSTTPVDPDEVSVEMSTPSADMFKNLARTLNL